eukprot:scaffold42942_cov81-Phaeocystis_antarctica.AAC.2
MLPLRDTSRPAALRARRAVPPPVAPVASPLAARPAAPPRTPRGATAWTTKRRRESATLEAAGSST